MNNLSSFKIHGHIRQMSRKRQVSVYQASVCVYHPYMLSLCIIPVNEARNMSVLHVDLKTVLPWGGRFISLGSHRVFLVAAFGYLL